jgi:uncharacterized protein
MATDVLPLPEEVRESESSPALRPVARKERISSIDVMRGAALLGIALMNIIFSGLPMAADFNPKVSGGSTGPNLWAFFLQYVLFDGKMRGLFSLMFGASTYLLITRLESRGAGIKAAQIYTRRLLWLMLFGMVHAYLIWHGDILYPYALLGLVLLPLISARPKSLLIAAGVLVVLMTGGQIGEGFSIIKTHNQAIAADKAEAAHQSLTDEQKAARKEWEDKRKYFSPTPADLKKEREMYSGSYPHLLSERAAIVMKWHSTPFYFNGWDMFTMMLLGIAFVKSGVLSAARSRRFYWRMLLISYGVSLPIAAFSAWLAWRQGFEPMQTVFTFTTYQLARTGTTLGHMSLLLLLCKSGALAWLRSRLAAIGQTAFSNYIAHSILYGLVFYGYGFNLFDKLQRYQLYLVVLGMWTFSLVASPIWLRHFRFGPLEWVWRSLTYWKRQPMRIREAAQVTVSQNPSSGTMVSLPDPT